MAILCDRFVNPPVVPHFVIRKGKVMKVMVVENDDVEYLEVAATSEKKKGKGVGKGKETGKKQVQKKKKKGREESNVLFDMSVGGGVKEKGEWLSEPEGEENGVAGDLEAGVEERAEEGIQDEKIEVVVGDASETEVELEGPHDEKEVAAADEVAVAEDGTAATVVEFRETIPAETAAVEEVLYERKHMSEVTTTPEASKPKITFALNYTSEFTSTEPVAVSTEFPESTPRPPPSSSQ